MLKVLRKAFVNGLNSDEKVTSQFLPEFKTRAQKPYPNWDQNGQNRYPIFAQNG